MFTVENVSFVIRVIVKRIGGGGGGANTRQRASRFSALAGKPLSFYFVTRRRPAKLSATRARQERRRANVRWTFSEVRYAERILFARVKLSTAVYGR